MTISHPGASRSPLRVASLEQKTLLAPRKLQGFQELRGRNQGERPVFLYYFTPFNEKKKLRDGSKLSVSITGFFQHVCEIVVVVIVELLSCV